ncbi:MAG: hypothetical protein D6706_04605, partial [Chloroflexi bacterium]
MSSSSELQIITGQLYIKEGVVQAETAVPGLLAQSAPGKVARGRERDTLFVHLSLSGQPEETSTLAEDLVDTISRQYFEATGSVTSALRRAVIRANELLLRLNLSGTSTVREGAITCAVARQGELFMVQAGESLALLGHNFGIERLPPRFPERPIPLGRSAGVEFRYFHHRLQPGDMLLLADPRIAHLPTQAFAAALVDSVAEEALDALQTIVGHNSARLLLVEFTDDPPPELPEVTGLIGRPQSKRTPVVPTPRREKPFVPTTTTARRPQPKRPFSGSPIRTPTADLETTARKATSRAAIGLASFTDWVAAILTRLRPPRQAEETESSPTNWAVPTLLAIIIPLIVAIIVTSVYLQRGRVRRFGEIKAAIGQNLALAEEAGDDEELARNYYYTVLALASEAEMLRPGDREIARLRDEALSHLDRLDGVTRLNTQLVYTYDTSVGLTAVALQEGETQGIYTLDGLNSQVFYHPTDESYLNPETAEPRQILFRGQVVGNYVITNLIDIMWRPKGQAVSRDGVAMLDSGGALITYYPNFDDLRAVTLGLASDWQLPRNITTFDERLYILDIGAQQIWKYFPDGDGFLLQENERTIFFSDNPDLAQAVDIAIYSEDGSLLVAYGDGRLRYYDTLSGTIKWQESDLLENGLNAPLQGITAVKMVGRGLNTSIFVADTATSRIIQISRGGIVLAQYRATDETG